MYHHTHHHSQTDFYLIACVSNHHTWLPNSRKLKTGYLGSINIPEVTVWRKSPCPPDIPASAHHAHCWRWQEVADSQPCGWIPQLARQRSWHPAQICCPSQETLSSINAGGGMMFSFACRSEIPGTSSPPSLLLPPPSPSSPLPPLFPILPPSSLFSPPSSLPPPSPRLPLSPFPLLSPSFPSPLPLLSPGH